MSSASSSSSLSSSSSSSEKTVWVKKASFHWLDGKEMADWGRGTVACVDGLIWSARTDPATDMYDLWISTVEEGPVWRGRFADSSPKGCLDVADVLDASETEVHIDRKGKQIRVRTPSGNTWILTQQLTAVEKDILVLSRLWRSKKSNLAPTPQHPLRRRRQLRRRPSSGLEIKRALNEMLFLSSADEKALQDEARRRVAGAPPLTPTKQKPASAAAKPIEAKAGGGGGGGGEGALMRTQTYWIAAACFLLLGLVLATFALAHISGEAVGPQFENSSLVCVPFAFRHCARFLCACAAVALAVPAVYCLVA